MPLGSAVRRWKEVQSEATVHRGIDRRWKGGYPQELVDWYNAGADGAINWGEDGDFEACVAVAGKYIDNPEGFCNERHQDATGAPPGKAPGESEAKSVDPAWYEKLTLAQMYTIGRDAFPDDVIEQREVKPKPTRSSAVAAKYTDPMIAAYQSGTAAQIASVLSKTYIAAYVAGLVAAGSLPNVGDQITNSIQADPIMNDLFDYDDDENDDEDNLFGDGSTTSTQLFDNIAVADPDDSSSPYASIAGLTTLLAGVEQTAENIVSYMNTDGAPDIEAQAMQMADTEAANGAEIGVQDASQEAGFSQMQPIPDDGACDDCLNAEPYDIGDDGPPWHPRCGCSSVPVGDGDSGTEITSAIGRYTRRDWAEWDLEHPYISDNEAQPGGAVPEEEYIKGFPINHMVDPVEYLQGSHADYAKESGITPTGNVTDFSTIMADPVRGPEIGALYSGLPDDDPDAHAAYQAMADEVGKQYDYMTNKLGITVGVQDTDPYPSVAEMVADVKDNHHISVLSTATTGAHPFFTNEQNDQFRAVHDVFGHAATGRGFDRNGEEAAWTAHSQMFSPLARQAMTSETRGQNSAMVWGDGQFQPQKVALLPQSYVERMKKLLSDLRHKSKLDGAIAAHEVEQAAHDADNLYSIGHSHHAACGRHFEKDYVAPNGKTDPDKFDDEVPLPSERMVTAEQIAAIEQRIAKGSSVREFRDWALWDEEHEGDGYKPASGIGRSDPDKHSHVDIGVSQKQASSLNMMLGGGSESWADAQHYGASLSDGRLVIPPEAHDAAKTALGQTFDIAGDVIKYNEEGAMDKAEAKSLMNLKAKLLKNGFDT